MAKFKDHEGNDLHILGGTVLTKWDRGKDSDGKDIPAGTTITIGGVAHRVTDSIDAVLKAIGAPAEKPAADKPAD